MKVKLRERKEPKVTGMGCKLNESKIGKAHTTGKRNLGERPLGGGRGGGWEGVGREGGETRLQVRASYFGKVHPGSGRGGRDGRAVDPSDRTVKPSRKNQLKGNF